MRVLWGIGTVMLGVLLIGVVVTLRVSKGAAWSVLVPPIEGKLLFYNLNDRIEQVIELDLGQRRSQHLFTMPGISRMSYNPDTTQIAFTQNTDNLYRLGVYDLATCEDTTLLTFDQDHHFVSWSPNGRHIAYQPVQGGISVIDMTTNETTAVTDIQGWVSWSEAGTAFYVWQDEVLYLVDVEAHTTTEISQMPVDEDIDSGAWKTSPDGNYAAYITYRQLEGENHALPTGFYVGDLADKSKVNISNLVFDHTWDKNGKLVYYDYYNGLVAFDVDRGGRIMAKICVYEWHTTGNLRINWSPPSLSFQGCQSTPIRQVTPDTSYLTPTRTHRCAREVN
ncbi:MAG: hypothetical protein AAF125_07920 [Chloroflexota bacterium]